MRSGLILLVSVVAAGVAAIALAGTPPVDPPPPPLPAPCLGDCVPRSELVAAQKLSAKRLRGWRRSARRAYQLHVTLMHRPDVVEAIRLAAIVYGVDVNWMLRRGSCESTGGHGHNPNAKNPGSTASGEFQFLTSTWATTPFARFSIFSPYANALAAGWMMGPAHRASEWSCP